MKDVKQVFDEAGITGIRCITVDEVNWFVASDIVKEIGYSNTRLIGKVCESDRREGYNGSDFYTVDSRGIKRYPVFVNDNGVAVIVSSCQLQRAKEIRDMIFADEQEQLTEQTDHENEAFTIFSNEEFGKVRSVIYDGEPWFVGFDIANALGYTNPKEALRNHVQPHNKIRYSSDDNPIDYDGINRGENFAPPSLPQSNRDINTHRLITGASSYQPNNWIDEGELKFIHSYTTEISNVFSTVDSFGRKQYPTFINESGVYSLILKSNLPSAVRFQEWVTEEVLPAIRKTGMYATDQLLDNPDLAIAAFTRLKEEREKRISAETKVIEMEPKALYYDKIICSKGKYGIREAASLLGLTQKQFTDFLIANHYMYRSPSGELKPYAQMLKCDPQIISANQFQNPHSGFSGIQYHFTPVGIDNIYNKLLKQSTQKKGRTIL